MMRRGESRKRGKNLRKMESSWECMIMFSMGWGMGDEDEEVGISLSPVGIRVECPPSTANLLSNLKELAGSVRILIRLCAV